ncbi:MAG: Xaa-Pro peptidase family protein [Bacteroidaceae bacterium]
MMNQEVKLHQDKIRALMSSSQIDAALISCNVNLLYAYGQIVSGYLYLPIVGEPMLFAKRPNNLSGENIFYIRRPEQIIELLTEQGIELPKKLMLEADELSFNEYTRLSNAFQCSTCVNGTPLIRQARSIKTNLEIELFRQAAVAHSRAYQQIPTIYRPNMSDLQFSIEAERLMRLEGCLGIFRVFGQSMEIFMGSVLTGSNAEIPSPYDFALGGKGMSVSLPGGLNGTKLTEGNTVMVDLGGNFNGYMCDMSRVFSIGKLKEETYRAHQVCLEVQDKVSSLAKPGITGEELYNAAIEIVDRKGLSDYFMGTKQKAKFIGHGIGLEINEAPVLAPRMKQELQAGMVFALEPKIVLPGIGPVGIENSWVVNENGVEKLTLCPEEIVEL